MCCRADPGERQYDLRPVHGRPHHQLHARPVRRQPAGRSNRSRRWPRRSASSSRRAYLSLASNVVAAAIQEASLRAQIEATKRIIAAQRETLVILRQQEGLGAITGADVATQQAALAQAETTLPPLQKALAQQRNLLATLTGRLPERSAGRALRAHRPQAAAGTAAQPAVEAGRAAARRARRGGQPAFGQRPGRRRDRQPVPADHAQRRHQHPGRSTFGHAVRARPDRLDRRRQRAADRARRRRAGGQEAAAQAALEQADAQYRSTVLTAFRNVADTLRALEYDALALQAAVDAERAAATSFTIARRRLELGDTTYVVVLIAELTYQQALLHPRAGAGQPLSPTRRRCSRRWAAAGGIATTDAMARRASRCACRLAPAPRPRRCKVMCQAMP